MIRFFRTFIVSVYFLACVSSLVFASRNVQCVAAVSALVITSQERTQEIQLSPTANETANIVDLEIEITNVDSSSACGYKVGQRINLSVVRDDLNTYNRIKKNVRIIPGTILKGSLDYVADENGDGRYVFENVSDVVNQEK